MKLFKEITEISTAPYLNADEQKALINGERKDYKDVKLSDVVTSTSNKLIHNTVKCQCLASQDYQTVAHNLLREKNKELLNYCDTEIKLRARITELEFKLESLNKGVK